MNEPEGAQYVLHQVRESGVMLIGLWFTDVVGRLKSVAITDEQLETALAEGVAFDGGTMNALMRSEETDLYLLPDPGTFAHLPRSGGEAPVARMFCDLVQADGSPLGLDPRTVLKRSLANAREEVEYYLFDTPVPPVRPVDDASYFDATARRALSQLQLDMVVALEQLGIAVESAHHEVGPGQQEVNLPQRRPEHGRRADDLPPRGQAARRGARLRDHLHAQAPA